MGWYGSPNPSRLHEIVFGYGCNDENLLRMLYEVNIIFSLDIQYSAC